MGEVHITVMMEKARKDVQSARNAAVTRQAMLDAARRQFAKESYENVGLRDIAGEVGVDPALVIRYFGSKENLFREVLNSPKSKTILEGINNSNLAEHLVSLIMEKEDDDAEIHLDRLLIILRSASSSKAAAIVYDAMDEVFLKPIASMLDTDDGHLRACLAMSVLMGSGMMQQVMGLATNCSPSEQDLMREKFLALFHAALDSSSKEESSSQIPA